MDGDDARPRRTRRDLEEIFGEILPATTSDERDPDRSDHDTDERYQRDRPPHHDRER